MAEEKERIVDSLRHVSCGMEERGECISRCRGKCSSVRKLSLCEKEAIADQLVDDGVLFPLCRIGDAVYTVDKKEVIEHIIDSIWTDGFVYRFTCRNEEGKMSLQFYDNQLHETVFVSPATATKLLCKNSKTSDHKEVVALAKSILKKYKMVNSHADLREIARGEGIKIVKNSDCNVLTPRQDSMICFDGMRWNIVYDDLLSPEEKRLAVARALGRIFGKGDKYRNYLRLCSNALGRYFEERGQEQREEVFAKCLLEHDDPENKTMAD